MYAHNITVGLLYRAAITARHGMHTDPLHSGSGRSWFTCNINPSGDTGEPLPHTRRQ